MTASPRITLNQFIEQRLGQDADAGRLLRTMFVRAFGADSFRDFWRYWNPVYGYGLYYYCYKPLRRFLPRPPCVIITFTCSGFFLHDLPFGWWVRALRSHSLPVPFVATWFVVLAFIMILADFFRVTLARLPFAAHVGVNSAYIALSLLLTLCLLGFMT